MGHSEACRGQAQERDRRQRHVHEIVGSVRIAEPNTDPHNHRFAAISGEAIPTGTGDHVHDICFCTDFYENHFHKFKGRSGGAINVGGGRHIHFAEDMTECADGHVHPFRAASLINDPIGD
ncbi:MAG: YmaF family protein [Butyricicoccus sp.]